MKQPFYVCAYLIVMLVGYLFFNPVSAQVSPTQQKVETLTDSIQSKRTQRKQQPTPVIGEKLQNVQSNKSDTLINNAKERIRKWNRDVTPEIVNEALPDNDVGNYWKNIV
ncbi:hypothetical protein [Dyadobacter sp. 3J3]|uniref:hypothetical protein n=1 Tax=Dyadobacter sp. 3J3 TaxID=2606600 RepID=UPI0013578BCA|nr:hypothetical protein [Dyadobacter sp. 3J3]